LPCNTGSESIERSESVEPILGAMDLEGEIKKVQCPISEKEINEGTYENVDESSEDNYFVIEKSLPDTNRIQECMPEGRRLVDLGFLWQEICYVLRTPRFPLSKTADRIIY